MAEMTDQTTEIRKFWDSTLEDVKLLSNHDFKTQELPLARIKKIMKLDEDVKMISAEAPVLFAKACEIFIQELSKRAWGHTEDNKRRTLQRNDIAMAISKFDQFDFLIDIVPRDEIKPAKRSDDSQRSAISMDPTQMFLQMVQQQPQASTSSATGGGVIATTGSGGVTTANVVTGQQGGSGGQQIQLGDAGNQLLQQPLQFTIQGQTYTIQQANSGTTNSNPTITEVTESQPQIIHVQSLTDQQQQQQQPQNTNTIPQKLLRRL